MITLNPINSFESKKIALQNQKNYSFRGGNPNEKNEFESNVKDADIESKSEVSKVTPELVIAYTNKNVQNSDINVSETQTIEKTQAVKNTADNEIGVPQEYIDLFERIKNLKGEKFDKAAFYGLREIIGLEDIAEIEEWPNDLGNATPTLNVTMNFVPSLISILFEKLSKDDSYKWAVLVSMGTALKQVQQYCDVLRLGDDAVARYKEKFIEIYMKQYSAKRKKVEPIVNQLDLSKVKNLPPYKPNSPKEKRAVKLLESIEAVPYMDVAIKKEKIKNNMALEEKHEYEVELWNYLKKWEESKTEPNEKLLKFINRKIKESEIYYDKYFSVYSSQFDFQGMGGIGY